MNAVEIKEAWIVEKEKMAAVPFKLSVVYLQALPDSEKPLAHTVVMGIRDINEVAEFPGDSKLFKTVRTKVDCEGLQISLNWKSGMQMRFNISTLLVLLAMMIQLIASCPSSCVVCSEEITLCQGLTYILAAPASTKALIITDGNITSVDGFNLSFLLNATLLTLSSNGITTIKDDAFLGLRTLNTLLLDQNQISSYSITYSTFHEFQKLQVLMLSNNILSSIQGAWFKNMNDLIRLHLNGNQLTSITGDSFGTANLGKLKSLDLSSNFITSIEKGAFQGLIQLVEMDLSRNRLTLISDTFSSLAQLRLLSLDQNLWNCTCQLYDLAFFLRKYVNSSGTLKNADNMRCRASENPSVTNLLELTEVNCKSPLKHPPGDIKNRKRNYRRDIALVAIFSFLGGVGLTCLVLALFNRKLQHGKANEHTSENCCCRTLDESQCGHEPRNYLTKGYCNCHLTRENEIKVMSVLGSGREMPLLQENSHQETVKAESKCTGLKMPLTSIEKENEQMKNDHFLCLNCRLLQSYPQESSWNIAVPNEEDVPSQKHFQRRIISPDNAGQREEDTQAAQLEDHSKVNQGIKSDIFCRRCATGKLGNHLANGLWQPLSKTEDTNCLKSPRQRYFIPNLSSAPDTTEESKEHCVQPALESHRSRCNDQSGSLERSRHISPPFDNFLICKYIDGDKYHNQPTEKKQNPNKNLKSEKEQNAVESGGTGDCCMSDDEMPLPSAIKRPCQPKSVSFYVPDLGTAKSVDVTTSGSSEVKVSKKSDSEGKGKDRKLPPISTCPGEKGNKSNGKHKIKAKNHYSLMVKLNLHPFRKARIHPEEHLPKENTQQNLPGQHGTLTESHQKLLHVSKKDGRKRKRKPEFSVAAQQRSDNGKEIISSRPSVNKLPEENGNNAATCTSCPSKNNSAIRVTEGISPASHLQAPNYINDSSSISPNGTSRMTVSVIALSSDNTVSQNTVSDTPTIFVSSEALKEDAPDTELSSFHQKSVMTATELQLPDGLTGADNMGKYGTKQANENLGSNHKLYKRFVPDAPIASVVLKEESVQTGEPWTHDINKVFQKSMVKVSMLSNLSSVSSNPEMGNMHLNRNVSDVHMNKEGDTQDDPNNQFDPGSNEHEDGKVPVELSLLPEHNIVSCGGEAEKSLQMEESKISFSNNNYPSLLCYKDKKPFSI